MPKMVEVPFAVQDGKSGPQQNSSEKLVNMFVETPSSGRSRLVRRQRPCLRSVNPLIGEKRCIERFKGVHYLISAATLYSFDGSTLTALGSLSTTTGRCSMVFNDNNQIMISDGANGYYWNGTMLLPMTLPGGVVVGTLGYLGGFGILNNVGGGQFYTTGADDFSTVNALDFATAESSPDPLVRVFVDHNELLLAGERTIEVWQLSGGADFPLQGVPTATIQRGVAAKFSLASEDGTFIALGDDRIVYRFDGYRPNRLSSDAVEESIRQVSADGVTNAHAMLFSIGGNKFYALTFPDELTVVYNFATGFWSEAASLGSNSWDVIGGNGTSTDYVLTDNGICELTPDVNQDEGVSCIRLARSAPGDAAGARITMYAMFVDAEVGRAAQGIDAQVMLRIARDGETFGNIRTRSLGLIGDYKRRAIFRGLGQGRHPVIELSASGDFNFAVMSTLLNAAVASS